jgi:hypothetical protein
MDSSLLHLSTLAFLLSTGTAFAGDIVVHAGRLIDGIDVTPRTNVSVLIHDDWIVSVEQGFKSPAGAQVIDLSQSTVLPGLIDCHVHITHQSDGGNPIVESVTRSSFDSAVRATTYARRTLLAGFTSVRDVGALSAGGVVIALKRSSTNPADRSFRGESEATLCHLSQQFFDDRCSVWCGGRWSAIAFPPANLAVDGNCARCIEGQCQAHIRRNSPLCIRMRSRLKLLMLCNDQSQTDQTDPQRKIEYPSSSRLNISSTFLCGLSQNASLVTAISHSVPSDPAQDATINLIGGRQR